MSGTELVSSSRTSVGVPREAPGEARVAVVPTAVPQLVKVGLDVVVERGAGELAGFPDDDYTTHGAKLGSLQDVLEADVVLRVRGWGLDPDGAGGPHTSHPEQIVVGLASPLGSRAVVRSAVEHKLTAFAIDLVPRISRAQAMDALSSQATVTGYKAVLLAADALPKMMPMFTTAAGTIPPAQVFVIGAGVAGLQAIATARRLGAVVQAYDVRAAAQEEIESLGARSIRMADPPADATATGGYAEALDEGSSLREQDLIANVVAGVDVVISTAMIPGKTAPLLITAEAVAGMRPGSVIVDCAAERGGNCELTRPDETVLSDNRVTILGPTNLPGSIPRDASFMFSKNVTAFILSIVKDGRIVIDEEDEIVRGALVTRKGEVVHPAVLESIGGVDHD